MKSKIGTVIRDKRKAKGYTQEKLAECIGVDSSLIGKIERGKTNPSIDTLAHITEFLTIDANRYFYDDYDKHQERKEFYLMYDRLSTNDRELIQLMLRHMSRKSKKR